MLNTPNVNMNHVNPKIACIIGGLKLYIYFIMLVHLQVHLEFHMDQILLHDEFHQVMRTFYFQQFYFLGARVPRVACQSQLHILGPCQLTILTVIGQMTCKVFHETAIFSNYGYRAYTSRHSTNLGSLQKYEINDAIFSDKGPILIFSNVYFQMCYYSKYFHSSFLHILGLLIFMRWYCYFWNVYIQQVQRHCNASNVQSWRFC